MAAGVYYNGWVGRMSVHYGGWVGGRCSVLVPFGLKT